MVARGNVFDFSNRGDEFLLGVDEVEGGNAIYRSGDTWIPQQTADGIVSRTLVKTLARNALVRRFEVIAQAQRADATTLANAGQLRLQFESGSTKFVIVDFGMLRTVGGVGVLSDEVAIQAPIIICALHAFTGADFSDEALFWSDCEAQDIDAMAVRTAEQNLFEVRTERVKLQLTTEVDLATIGNRVFLEFPDLPSDLDLRIDNGPPVFVSPGAAQPNARGWDADSKQTIDLTAALSALTGTATDETSLPLQIVLASRIPGDLDLTEKTATTDISWLTRVLFEGEPQHVLDFTEEGVQDVVLPLPSWVNKVEEVRMTMTAEVPPERILPPVGPAVATLGSSTTSAVDLLLDVDHSAAALLPAVGLAELTGVRLPLSAGEDGAEVRVLLYDGDAQGPLTVVEAAASTPVLLEAGQDETGDAWSTFSFPQPVKLSGTTPRWAVIIVGRGSVAWSLGRYGSIDTAIAVRRGSPGGPWYPLPSLLSDGTAGARIRQMGTAPRDAPIAPLTLEGIGAAAGGVMDATPTVKGARIIWTPKGTPGPHGRPLLTPQTAGGKSITLRITSRMTGRITLSDVDVVATK
jgi:hypothetical protein